MRRLLLPLFLLAFAPLMFAQVQGRDIWFVTVDPGGACLNGTAMQYNFINGNFWGCKNSVWTQVSGGGGGTVTSVSFPTIPAWLTASVATPTTTPAISVTATAGQISHQVIGTCDSATTFGPCALVAGDLPAGTGTVTSVVTTSPIIGGPITTTGTIACATCATTTNGGLLSATSPVTISAAGVIACATCSTTTGTVTSFSAGALSPLFTTSVATATTTPALTFALSNAAAQTVLSGPSAYGVAAAAPTYRALTPQDIPAGYSSCAIPDNVICTSAVSSGNPNFLTTAANTVLPINGGTTPLIMFIGGVYQSLNTNVTLTVPSTASVPQWILAKQDIANANMVAGDFLAMNTAPAYAYTAPTCPSPGTALSSTNPAFWFDLSTNLSKLCTSNGGAYSASPAIVIGVVWVDATPKVLSVAMEPYRLNPYKRFEFFGNGSDGTLTITSGTTTIDAMKQYASVIMSAGTLTHSLAGQGSPQTTGVVFSSQNPVLIFGTGTIQGNVLGGSISAGGTGAGASGGTYGFGGAGGGGGGSGTTSAAGGAGGSPQVTSRFNGAIGGGTAGAATPTAGGNGASTIVLPQLKSYFLDCYGQAGGNGAGDGTNLGGRGGFGGGSIQIIAPSIVVDTGGSITSNGGNGANGAGGNAGAGGGGGGGCVILNGGYVFTTNGTATAALGTGGTGQGTGKNGGNGGTGIFQANRLW